MNSTLRIVSIVLMATLASCQSTKLTNPDITELELQQSIQFLASDSLKGRLPGTVEDRIAAKYIKDKFNKNGIKLLGERGYQFFQIIKEQQLGTNKIYFGNENLFQLGKDFTPFPFSASDSISAPVVFVGYGIELTTKKIMWHDYELITANNKWVMILRGVPGKDSLGNPFADYAGDRIKALTAKDQGAAGIIFVSGSNFDKEDALVDPLTKDYSIGIPVIQITRTLADRILSKSQHTIAQIENITAHQTQGMSFETGVEISVLTAIHSKQEKTQNVIAEIIGSDSTLKHQYVIIGAHYDHLGMGGPGSSSRRPDTIAVHNGADDNASGVAALLEIAEKMATHRDSIKRSVIFIAFGGEEMGLLGSKEFVNDPPINLKQVQAMINIDMVGRLNKKSDLQVSGVGTSDFGGQLLTSIPDPDSLNIITSPEGYGPSDHASFYGKNIPVYFFTTGAHMDYHTPFDDADKINYIGLKKSADYIYQLAITLANKSQKLTFKEAGPKSGGDYSRGKRFKVTLGIMPDISGQSNDGLRADFVTNGKPAYRGGMQNGDVITAIDGKEVKNIQDYMARLMTLKEGQTISVEVRRNNEQKILIIKL
jgi:Predicted aminopeptidases